MAPRGTVTTPELEKGNAFEQSLAQDALQSTDASRWMVRHGH